MKVQSLQVKIKVWTHDTHAPNVINHVLCLYG
jgi:hypothetical protein